MPPEKTASIYFLTIDTATDELSVAVVDGNKKVLSHQQLTVWRDMAARLQPTILAVLEDAGITFNDLSSIYTNLGPGSFTSIRIGLAAVKALSFALAIPAYGASGMQALARAHKGARVVVCLKAVGPDVYWQVFDAKGQPEAEPCCQPLPEALATCPKGVRLLTNLDLTDAPLPEGVHPERVSAATPLNLMACAGGSGHSGELKPIYIRPLTYKKLA